MYTMLVLGRQRNKFVTDLWLTLLVNMQYYITSLWSIFQDTQRDFTNVKKKIEKDKIT